MSSRRVAPDRLAPCSPSTESTSVTKIVAGILDTDNLRCARRGRLQAGSDMQGLHSPIRERRPMHMQTPRAIGSTDHQVLCRHLAYDRPDLLLHNVPASLQIDGAKFSGDGSQLCSVRFGSGLSQTPEVGSRQGK
jgi:hypothetical protein